MYRYSPYGRDKARKGEGWHKRGWRDFDGSMAVSVAFSPKCYGSHTLMVQPHETADRLLRAAVQTQCDDVDLRGRHVVLVHKKRELVGLKTAADYSIESADTLHLKLFDRYGNQLRWDDYSYVKEYGAGDHNYHTLAEAFEEDPYADESPAEMRSLARLAGVNPGFVTDWFMWARAAGGVGGDEPGDRGRVAQAERRAEKELRARERMRRRGRQRRLRRASRSSSRWPCPCTARRSRSGPTTSPPSGSTRGRTHRPSGRPSSTPATAQPRWSRSRSRVPPGCAPARTA